MPSWFAKSVFIARLAVLVGCVGAAAEPDLEEDAAPPEKSEADVVRALVREHWLGERIGLRAPNAIDLGAVEIVRDARDPESPLFLLDDLAEAEAEAEPELGDGKIVAGANGHEYLLDLPTSPELDDLMGQRLDAELDDALEHGEIEQAEGEGDGTLPVEKGRVGADNRRRYGIRDGYSAKDWLASIGVMTLADDYNRTTCTATLISRDVALTAAHCLVKAGSNGRHSIRPAAFHPRADRSQATRFPWGSWTWTGHYYVDPGFISSRCYTQYKRSCAKYDWALIRFKRPAAASNFGLYMRYKTVSNAAMVGLKNRGYAGCGLAESPPNCISHTLFGDINSCAPGITDNSNDGGYSMAVTHSCDTNPGHSGSPVYFYDAANAGKPTIVGVHVSDNGIAGDLLGTGNWMRHVTPTVVSKINSVLSTL